MKAKASKQPKRAKAKGRKVKDLPKLPERLARKVSGGLSTLTDINVKTPQIPSAQVPPPIRSFGITIT